MRNHQLVLPVPVPVPVPVRWPLLALCLLIGTSLLPLFGQTIADWTFGSNAAPTSADPNATVPNAVYTTPTPVTAISGNRFSSQGWDVAALDPTRFFEVKITPNNTYRLTATQFAINMERTAASGPTAYEIRISVDGFSSFTAIGSGSLPQSTVTNISLPISTVVQTTATLTIRAFFWGATNAIRTVSIGRASINGTVQQPALPVSLIRFQGKVTGNVVQLTWATAWEQNTDRYVVERSPNASAFTDAGTFRAAGTADGPRTYNFTDEGPVDGVNYYRLKQVDLDQSYTYSKLIAVQVRAGQPSARVYPNPTDGQQIRVQVRGLIAPTASVHALTGQVLTGTWVRLTDTEATWQPTVPLPAGTYLFTVQDGVTRQAIKVLVW